MNGSTCRSVAGALIVATWAVATHGASLGEQLSGTWTLVAVTYESAGVRREPFGPDPRGFMTLHPNGRYSITLLRSDLPRIASNNRETGTVEESKAIAAGVLAHYGTYTVDDAARTIQFRIEASTFPNWNGARQLRPIALLTADALTWDVPTPPQGTGTSQVLWKRAK